MKKIAILLMCFIICFNGCAVVKNDNPETSTVPSGVYYKKIDDSIVEYRYNPMVCYAWTTLYYDGKIYTSSASALMNESSENKEDLNLDEVLGEELGTVYGNHGIYWATDKDKLREVTHETKLYKVKNYDPAFCVGIYYEIETLGGDIIYHIDIFEHLNDIYLDKGVDLYTTRYNIDTATEVEIYGAEHEYINTLSCSDDKITNLLTKIAEASFISTADEACPKLDGYDAKLLFKYDNGLGVETFIYSEGYMAMKKYGEIYVLHVGEDVCKAIIK